MRGTPHHTVALCRISAEREEQQLDTTVVQVFHLHDGKVSSVWTYPCQTDTFWSATGA